MNYSPGTVVCVHGFEDGTTSWMGTVTSIHGDPGEGTFTVYVKQLGAIASSFPCALEELYETVMTFEGLMCTACKQAC